jgi:ferric-dicitrate binding protein FerR (iron transport regulator)
LKKEISHTINAFLNNSLESSKEKELEKWIKKGDNQKEFDQFIVANHLSNMASIKFDVDHAFEKFEKETGKKENNTSGLLISLKKYYKYAAILAIAIFTGVYLFKFNTNTSQNFVSIKVPMSEKRNFELPDGSKIQINSGTIFSYNKDFLNNRLVKLTGEAFFDVTKLKGKQFVVQLSNGFQIKVLGTSFGVKSYKEDFKIEASLIEGKIELLSKELIQKTLIIKPNSTAIIDKKTKSIHIIKDKGYTAKTLSWKSDTFHFENDYLLDIINDFNRNFNTKIEIQSDELKKTIFTASFKKGTSLETMLANLSLTGNFKVSKIDTNHFIISNQ